MSTVRSYPPTGTRPHRIMTSTARTHTESAPNGFVQSVMRQHRDMDDLDKGVVVVDRPEKKFTQKEQDVYDEEARKRALKNLVNFWQERLQLISVITTFFATTEATILVNTKPPDGELGSNIMQASNACFLGSLIMHVYASVLSFLGAFILITHKLREATREEMIAEGIKLNSPITPSLIKDLARDAGVVQQHPMPTNDDTRSAMYKFAKHDATTSTPKKDETEDSSSSEPPVLSSNPRVEQVGIFVSNVSSHLLSRSHALYVCVFLTAVGFVLAIVGIMCYAWALESLVVSIFASACLGFALLGMVILRI